MEIFLPIGAPLGFRSRRTAAPAKSDEHATNCMMRRAESQQASPQERNGGRREREPHTHARARARPISLSHSSQLSLSLSLTPSLSLHFVPSHSFSLAHTYVRSFVRFYSRQLAPLYLTRLETHTIPHHSDAARYASNVGFSLARIKPRKERAGAKLGCARRQRFEGATSFAQYDVRTCSVTRLATGPHSPQTIECRWIRDG